MKIREQFLQPLRLGPVNTNCCISCCLHIQFFYYIMEPLGTEYSIQDTSEQCYEVQNRTAVVQRWLTLLKWDHNVVIILTLNVQMSTINNQPDLINLFLQQDNNDIIDQWFLNAFFPNMTQPHWNALWDLNQLSGSRICYIFLVVIFEWFFFHLCF